MSPPRQERGGDSHPVTEAVAERLADTMFALSAPSRVLILGYLLDGPHSVRDLMEALSMEQSAVSHQLRVLREHELVRAEKVGRLRLYALYDEHVATLLHAGLDHVQRDYPMTPAATRPSSAPGRSAGGVS